MATTQLVHEGSPLQSGQTTACVFAHTAGSEFIGEYVFHYLQCLKQIGCVTVFCSSTVQLRTEDLARLQTLCHQVVLGVPPGHLFHVYRAGLGLLQADKDSWDKVVFTHDQLYGPLNDLGPLLRFGDERDLDIWSASDGFASGYYLHSDFLVMRAEALAHPSVREFWDLLPALLPEAGNTESHRASLRLIEMDACTRFTDGLLRLGAFCSVSDVRRHVADVLASQLPDRSSIRRRLLDGVNVRQDVRQAYWDLIVETFRYPFIHADLLRHNPLGVDMDGWDALVQRQAGYDVDLIGQDLREYHHADTSKQLAWLLDEVETPAGIRLPYFLTQLLTTWPDLEEKLNIGVATEEAVLNSMAFWEHPQRKAMPDLDWPAENRFPDVVYEPAPGIVQDSALPITKGALAVWRTRTDIQSFDLNTFLGRQQFTHWRLTLGQLEYRFLALTDRDIAHLHAPCQVFAGRISHLPNLALLSAIFHTTASIVQQLQEGDVAAYEQWWPWKQVELTAMLDGLVKHPPLKKSGFRAGLPRGTRHERGVNVVGLPNGQFGVGEDARTATRALLRAGVDTCVCPAPIGALTTVYKPEWTDDLVSSTPKARTNLICLPAADTYQLILKGWAPVLAGRYNICAWQWELPVWPKRWVPLLNIPDEIWAQSRYVADMFAKTTDKPVTYMPLSIDKPVFSPRGKAFFGIPDNAYTFLSVFDCNSWIKRKNPMGAVKAFATAFPPGRADVRLVVKIMNSQASIPEYQELLAQVAKDSRIILIDKFLPRNDMLALIDACDVFVSLHRSEGFGRVIAEAMYMGKPVISTNYSGSVDFAFEGTAYTVDGPLVPLRQGDYVEFEGQYWMDPDIDAAAAAFRCCVEEEDRTQAIALAGQRQISENHTIQKIAHRYLERLKALNID